MKAAEEADAEVGPEEHVEADVRVAVIVPYSATWSAQQDSSPIYANADVGFNVLFGPDFRIGVFGGFHYMNETVSAFGCTQAAFNPNICGFFPVSDALSILFLAR